MRIIAVDDMRPALRPAQQAIREACPEADVAGFTSAKEALEYAKGAALAENPVDVAFLDIDMGEMNGLFLAKHLKDIHGRTNIIFVTAYSQYAMDAFSMHVSGYIMKPLSADRVREEIENLRDSVALPDKGLRVQCFGSFEVFADGKPVRFPRSKSKEIFAYLIHKNGASCTIPELAAELFEEVTEPKSVRVYIAGMVKTLKDAGYDGVVVKSFNRIAVDTSKFDCDYYRFLKTDASAVNAFMGEYMAQYSWAEFITGYLEGKIESSAAD